MAYHTAVAGVIMLPIWWKWKVMFRDRDSKGNEELPAGGF